MTEQNLDDLWPTLNDAHGGPNASRVTWQNDLVPEGDPEWEIVVGGQEFVEGAENEGIEAHVVVVPPDPKALRHCASSPDLRFLEQGKLLEVVSEHHEDDEPALLDDDSSSHVLVSGPSSVVSIASATSKMTIKRIPSFRDAILAQKEAASEGQQEESSSDVNEEIVPIKRSQNKRRPKIVVTPIKRCVRSTGDLKSLAEEDEVPMGETDATEYYSQKSMGASGRVNGLKERPDEAKRKTMIMYKKDMQRQKQSAKRK